MSETVYAVLGAVLLFLICYSMYRKFADPSVHYSIAIVVLTSWYTNILCVILFSLDVYYVSCPVLRGSSRRQSKAGPGSLI